MIEQEMRELDKWIGINVFGFKWGHFGFVKGGLPDFAGEPIYLLPPAHFEKHAPGRANLFPLDKVAGWKAKGSGSLLPSYTTSPADAMAVLEKCAEKVVSSPRFAIAIIIDPASRKFLVALESFCDGDDEACENSCASAETLPLAICLFAKKLYE